LKNLGKFAVLGAVLALSASAFATTLTNGATVVPTTIGTASLTQVSGTLSGTIAPGTFNASYLTGVFSDTSNVFCSGCLDFIYVFSTASGVVERATMFNFDGFLTDVEYILNGGVNPVSATRTADGSTVSFQFSSAGVAAGQGSAFLVIETNSTNFTNGLFSLQDGSAGTAAAFQPTAATPEPNSLMLMGTGLVSAAGMVLRRRRSIA
jgi:hypothetical protein